MKTHKKKKNEEFEKRAAAIWERMTWGIDRWHDEVLKLESVIFRLKKLDLPCYAHFCNDENEMYCDEDNLCDACKVKRIVNGI